MLYGELSFDQEEAVEQHLAGCADCRAALAAERRLHLLFDDAAPELPAGLLPQCRASLREAIAPGRDRVPFWRGLFSRDWLDGASFWKPAGALALLALGFLGGRLIPPGAAPGPNVETASILPAARSVRMIEPDASGNVRIVFDETREHVVEGRCADSRIQGVLVSAAERDPNPAVRLKALEGLKPYASDSAVRQALVRVLAADDHPGVRAQVIEVLTRGGAERLIDAHMVGALQELVRREQDGYVRDQCRRALQQVKASPEIF
jgi:anti-sigma factor RsiW